MGMTSSDLLPLIRKYSTLGPRYTSYPTAPQWSDSIGVSTYKRALENAVSVNGPLALYVHIPFCEALCYYCGCNIQITKDKTRGAGYVDSLMSEMAWVCEKLGRRKGLSQISWGGGSPTFLPSEQMRRLHQAIKENFEIETDAEVSIEVDPRITSDEQFEVLRELGFNRVSLGLQDFNPDVQKAVNRVQSESDTARVIALARNLGFTGTNLDLIYGLPYQTIQSFNETADRVLKILPDRIALYNYAHLPSLRPHQKILEKMPMPSADDRLAIFLAAFDKFTKAGYVPIGMDHFALPNDELALSLSRGALYRNFMGYSVKRGAGLIGIGASAIGDISGSYFQNIRETKLYQDKVQELGTAVFRGCILSEDDMQRRAIIQSVMCRFEVDYSKFRDTFQLDFPSAFAKELELLSSMESDGLLTKGAKGLKITEVGRLFLRNIAMVFDAYLNKPTNAIYSKTV